jgi:cytochrome oxidase Cu insertion factor (SCO1/SenC/PrrC family)
MEANQPALAEPSKQRPGVYRFRWLFWVVALAIGIGAGTGLAVLSQTQPTVAIGGATPTQTWSAGVRRAPAFTLIDQRGREVSLAALHGRPVIVTFIDPLCRNFCPREASILTEAAARLGPEAPTIVSVSVDPWADSAANFRLDAVRWRLGPDWRWGTGSYAQLARVWKRYYIAVAVSTRTIAGVRLRTIIHTGAAYLIDGAGYERALLLYPFDASQVESAARSMLVGSA